MLLIFKIFINKILLEPFFSVLSYLIINHFQKIELGRHIFRFNFWGQFVKKHGADSLLQLVFINIWWFSLNIVTLIRDYTFFFLSDWNFTSSIVLSIIFLSKVFSCLLKLLKKQIIVSSHSRINMKLIREPLLINVYLDLLLNLLVLIKHLGLHLITRFLLWYVWIKLLKLRVIFVCHNFLSYHLHVVSVHCLVKLLHFIRLDCFLLSNCNFSFILMNLVFLWQLHKIMSVHLISFIF